MRPLLRLLILVALAMPHFASAQALAPDAAFGTNGEVITTFPGYDGRATYMAGLTRFLKVAR